MYVCMYVYIYIYIYIYTYTYLTYTYTYIYIHTSYTHIHILRDPGRREARAAHGARLHADKRHGRKKLGTYRVHTCTLQCADYGSIRGNY